MASSDQAKFRAGRRWYAPRARNSHGLVNPATRTPSNVCRERNTYGWRGIVMCNHNQSGTMIIRSSIVFVRTVKAPDRVSIRFLDRRHSPVP